MQKKARFALFSANMLLHYDSSLFGWIAPFLAPVFFPGKSPIEALMLTFAFLPLSYLAKPLGALFWGALGDQVGRKPVLIGSIFGMTLSTFAIGLIPLTSYAWILLAICRILQGFFSAGEQKGGALILMEHLEQKQRPLSSALYDGSGILGVFFASLLVSIWGEGYWRALFFVASLTGFITLFLRRGIEESPDYTPTPFSWKIFYKEKWPLFQVACTSGFSYGNYFLLSIFLNGLLPEITSMGRVDVLQFNTHLLWIDFFLLLSFGALCKYVQKEYIMLFGSLCSIFLIFPLFLHLEGSSWAKCAFIRISLVVFGTALAAPYHAWKMDILPKNHRFLIGGVGSALGAKLFGAPIPFISSWLIMKTGKVWMAPMPVFLLAFITSWILISHLLAKRQKAVLDL